MAIFPYLRIPAQAATRIRFIPPPDSDSSRHPIPIDSAMGIRFHSATPWKRVKMTLDKPNESR